MSAPEVLAVIASLDGGYNGELLNKRLGVQITGETTAIYTLTDESVDPPTVETFSVVVTPI